MAWTNAAPIPMIKSITLLLPRLCSEPRAAACTSKSPSTAISWSASRWPPEAWLRSMSASRRVWRCSNGGAGPRRKIRGSLKRRAPAGRRLLFLLPDPLALLQYLVVFFELSGHQHLFDAPHLLVVNPIQLRTGARALLLKRGLVLSVDVVEDRLQLLDLLVVELQPVLIKRDQALDELLRIFRRRLARLRRGGVIQPVGEEAEHASASENQADVQANRGAREFHCTSPPARRSAASFECASSRTSTYVLAL